MLYLPEKAWSFNNDSGYFFFYHDEDDRLVSLEYRKHNHNSLSSLFISYYDGSLQQNEVEDRLTDIAQKIYAHDFRIDYHDTNGIKILKRKDFSYKEVPLSPEI